MASFHTKTFTKYDDYATPKSAFENIKQFIPKEKILYEPFYCDGIAGVYLKEIGCRKVIHEPTLDFFIDSETLDYDFILSNIPYSQKKEVLTHLKKIDKPFMLLCPISMLNTNYLRELFANDIQLIIPRKRIQFYKIVNKERTFPGKCNFETAWFCYKMKLPRDLNFLS